MCSPITIHSSSVLSVKLSQDAPSGAPEPLLFRSQIGGDTARWIRPLTLSELTQKVKAFVMEGKTNIRYVVGNTSTGKLLFNQIIICWRLEMVEIFFEDIQIEVMLIGFVYDNCLVNLKVAKVISMVTANARSVPAQFGRHLSVLWLQ